MTIQVVIKYTNGSCDHISQKTHADADAYCRDHISYSGGKVARVEIHQCATRAVYDINWNDYSKTKAPHV